jgi:hypothetical protein
VALTARGVALKPGRVGAGAVGPAVLAQAAPSNPSKIIAIYVSEAHIMYFIWRCSEKKGCMGGVGGRGGTGT